MMIREMMESDREQGKESALLAVARRLTKSKGKLDQHDDVTRLNIRGLYIQRYILEEKKQKKGESFPLPVFVVVVVVVDLLFSVIADVV
jgi:hypothetical protein